MRSRRRVGLTASFVITLAALPACGNTTSHATNNPPAPNPPPIASQNVAATAGTQPADASVDPPLDAGDDGAAPFRRHGPILNPPHPRPAPSGN